MEGLEAAEPEEAARGDVFRHDCPGRAVLDHVTSRWGLLVLAALRPAPRRFFELRDRIGGVSEKMLSQSLRTLTRDGLVERMVEPTVPPQVTYALTDLGRSLTALLHQLVDWVAAHTDDILAAQATHDQLNDR